VADGASHTLVWTLADALVGAVETFVAAAATS
jgi:hypothetical protein